MCVSISPRHSSQPQVLEPLLTDLSKHLQAISTHLAMATAAPKEPDHLNYPNLASSEQLSTLSHLSDDGSDQQPPSLAPPLHAQHHTSAKLAQSNHDVHSA